MKTIFTTVLCTAAIIGQISMASAQHEYPAGGTAPPAAVCCALQPVDLGWAYTRIQPVGYSGPFSSSANA